ncbi:MULTISPECIES: winged helix-turn-helix transcriptional regulator [Microbacterium]|uniref:HTH-type transcriptional activator HxlR n=1 Tax=Microbacterium ginsengisoli TaxID=400772 RepID=A0A0F0LVF5_9MICO|nr:MULTISPECIES: helix-turn-helix domain-containing protein [Microbacterium]KJL37113.1 HTH-type transcriptional activator HxlR [Microbacterium ginsengisoli]MCK9913364.1 helix-turn-helix transcriptional regulator [Microbacteriaceae bacterium K1510]
MKPPSPVNERCSIARTLVVLGEKWALLVVRDIALGVTRFADIRSRLEVAPDVLSDRLSKLVDLGVIERRAYRDEGARQRDEYTLTAAGAALLPVLGALSQWGDVHVASPWGPATRYVDARDGGDVRIAFVDAHGRAVDREQVAVVPGPGALVA